jgi:lysophospholipase L1-like esterase
MNKSVLTLAAVICIFSSGFSSGVMAANRFVTPIIIGDSWSNSYWDWPGSTTEVVWSQYRDHAISGDWLSVQNAENQQGMVLNIADYLDLNPDADSLIIQGGINDIFNNVDAATMKAALQSIVAEAKSRSNIIDIVVISPGPFGGVPSGWNQGKQNELEDYIDWLPGFAQSEQIDWYIVYDDVNHKDYPWIISDGSNGEPNYTSDGLHLNALGVARMALGVDLLIGEIRSRPLQIDIDIDPWNDANEVRPDDDYLLTVAVVSSSISAGGTIDFDAMQIDPASLKFGLDDAPNVVVQPIVRDLNGDSLSDVVIGFRMEETGIQCEDTSVVLDGETYSGDVFKGTDFITTVECETGGCHP